MWTIGTVGFCGALLAFILSFVPPSQISVGSNTVWFSVLIIGCVVVVGAPFVIYAMRKALVERPAGGCGIRTLPLGSKSSPGNTEHSAKQPAKYG